MANVIEFSIKAVDDFTTTMGKVTKSLTNAAKTVAKYTAVAGAAVVAGVAFVNSMASLQDNAQKMSERLGIAVDQLTELQYAGQRSGISTEQLNMSLQRMTRRVAEASQGTGELAPALQELGVDAEELGKKTPDEQLRVLSDAFANVENQSDKVRLAFKAFDSEGVAMLQMVGEGSEKMNALAEDARFLGVSMNAQGTANAALFSDSMTRLGSSIKGVSLSIANEWIPIMTGFINSIADGIARSRGTITAFAKAAIDAFLFLFAGARQSLTAIYRAIRETFSAEGFDRFIEGAQNTFVWLAEYAFTQLESLGRIIISVFKIAWESVVTLGQWAWDSIKSIFTGEESISIGEALFTKIPEATAKARAELAAATSDIVMNSVQAATDAGSAFGEIFGVTGETIKAEVNEIKAAFTEVANAAIASGKAGADGVELQYTAMVEQVKSKIGHISTMFGNLATLMATKNKRMFAIGKAAAKAQAIVDTYAGAQKAYTALAGIPIIGPSLGVAAAAAAIAAGLVRVSQINSQQFTAAAHGGMTNIPSEGTYFLDRGERVLSPRQNTDLTDFINEKRQSSGAGMTLNLTMNVSGESLLHASEDQWKEAVANKIIPAFDELAELGVRTQVA